MNLSNLKPAAGSVHKDGKRLGRGEGSGKGGTSTKGHKGAQSRSGYNRRPGFEGGQMPMQRRLPKVGFNNFNFRTEYAVLNLSRLQEIADKFKLSEISIENLRQNKIISKTDLVKVLGHGELKSKLNLKVNAISANAKAAVEKQGGAVEIVK